jgi:putative nucleotidyltransferase with HDIG domain
MTVKRSLTFLSTFALAAGWLTVVPQGQRRAMLSDDLSHHPSGGAVAAESRQPLMRVWREFLPLALSYAAGASVSLLLVVAMREMHLGAIALILPLVFVSYVTMRSSFSRLEDAKAHVSQLNRLMLSAVETLATAIDAKDEVTHDHVRRVQAAALALAREIGVSDAETLKAIEAAALLHDTGKIAIPEHILNKPGRLSRAEFEKMKLHAPIGAEILSSIEFPYPVVPIVRHHHENFDGTGYPDGLKGTDIPLGARILSVVDCFDALTSDRPYRRRMDDQTALGILRDRRGTMYDPVVVDAFQAAHERIMPAADPTLHPVARAIGGARTRLRDMPEAHTVLPAGDVAIADEALAIGSLARAMCGEASLRDAASLVWMLVRQMVPTAAAMAVFLPDDDDDQDSLAVRCASGVHAARLRGTRVAMGSGIAGWVAVNRRSVANGEPSLDLGVEAAGLTPPLLSALTLPLIQQDTVVAVVALYATTPHAFADHHARVLDLLAPHLATAVAATLDLDEPQTRRGADLKLVRGALA